MGRFARSRPQGMKITGAFGGRLLGSEQLATFDLNASRLLSEAGEPLLLL